MAPVFCHPAWTDVAARSAPTWMVGHRTVPGTAGSLLVFSRIVKRRQIRRRMAACWLDARGVLLDACHYASCQFESGTPRRAIRLRFLARTNCFQKWRAIDSRINREHGRIEAFNVADLENPRMLPGRAQERVRIREIFCHGFFYENIDAKFHQAAAHLCVGTSWNGYAYRINRALHRFQGRERLRAEVLRESRSACCIRIEHPREL